jgi:LEA14-like dessication related protein
MLVLRSLFLSSMLLLAACTTLNDFDDPIVELVAIKPLPPEGMEQALQLTLRVMNPNAQAFTITGIYSELSLRGSAFVRGVGNDSVTVPAYGEAMLQMKATASFMGTLSLFRELVMNPPQEGGLEYALSSKLSIKNYGTLRLGNEGVVALPAPR